MPSGKPVLKPAAKKDRLEEERELLRRLLEQEGLGSPAEQAGSEQGPASPEAAGAASSFYPLSSQQEQLWFLDQFQPASDFYNVPLVLRLKGELNASRLEQSLQEVVRRHEILRTCFVLDENGDPKQSVLQKTSGIGLPLTDLRDLSSSEREERAKKIVAEQGKTIFDLSHAPLFRGALLRMDEKEYVFALTMHHILCDEWSLGVFMEELTELYEAYEKGEESPLPQLGMQYGEYARDQWEGLRAGKFRQQMEYWKTELAGMPQALELQTDYTRQVHQSFRGGIQHQALESELLDGLNALARSEGASMFMTLLAVFQVLLMRYTGQEDFGIGTSIANRGRSSTQRLIGFFLNTLVMRARLRGEPSFRQVQQQVRTAALNAYEHQDLPFQRVVEELAPGRDVSRNPLVQVMFTVRKPAKSKAGRFDVGEFEAGIETSKFDLTLIVEESDEPKIAFNYSTELFESETIVRMLGHYHRLLQAVVRSQEVRVWDLPLLTDAEMAQLIQWNRTDRQYEREKSAAELFEQCAAKMPNAVAVEYQGRELTYGELNRKSNRLAHRLRELGVHSEQRVAIYLERGLEMVVGLLSVLKAQGAYVPMDPQYPQEHLWYMLRDSAPRVLLTQAHLLEALGTIDGHVAVVDLGGALGDSEWLQRLPETNPESVRLDPQADPLAYLIYTSGSTGMPKGVMVSHRNLVSSTTARRLVYGDLGRFLLLSSISFDSSVAGIFGSLLHGGTLIIASSDVVRDPWLLHQEVQSRGVETLLCVPSLWKHFLEYPASREQKKQLRRVIVAGEVCPPDLVAKSAQLEPQVKLFNEYGPTEGTVWASVHRCIPTPGSRSVPIGRPIANTHIYILDARGKRVPVGVVGELYLGGAGVARGYWARPTLTAERFLPNPFADERSMRMYRTGDLARWLPDGTIEFIGRNDAQVKIRGYRVELGEIERVLREHPDVQDVVVNAQEDPRGTRLVAYVVEQSSEQDSKAAVLEELGLQRSASEEQPAAENGHDAKADNAVVNGAAANGTAANSPAYRFLAQKVAADLRRALKKKLPEHMIPTAFVKLKSLPFTANGKIDRQALPVVQALESGDGGEGFEAPRTPTERRVAEIWKSVLGLSQIGRRANFFELGGHSLLAISMASRIRSELGMEEPVRAIFESPTIAELAEAIDLELKSRGKKLPDVAHAASKPAASGVRPSVFPLSHQQEQLWFLDRFQPDSDFYNVPYAWTIKGDFDVPRFERSLREIVRRHEMLRTCFVEDDDQSVVQKVLEEVDLRLLLVDLRPFDASEREGRARKILAEEAGKGFDLRKAPLLRCVLVRVEENEYFFGLTLHHIICDEWSIRVLLDEWRAFYDAFGRGEESPLQELSMQYGDYALEQRDGLHGGKLQQQVDYWKNQLKGMPHVLELPTDFSRPARQSFRGKMAQHSLSVELWEGVNVVAKAERASLFMTLLAACQVLFMRYTGQEDFGIGTVVSNRTRRETERLIGFFLNTLVFRANLSGEPTFREALQRLRQAALGGFEHQDISFEKLVEELSPDRDISRTPLFQVLFTSLGEAEPMKFGGLEWTDFGQDLDMAKFDLAISVQEERRGAVVTVNYTTDLFEPETIKRMVGHYAQLLKAAAENPGQRIWNLPILTVEESAQLEGWNRTAKDYPHDKTIAGLFEEHVEKTPDAIAVEFEGRELSYGDLNRQANRLAHYLRALGVKPDTLVTICAERSFEMIVGLVAVMKAGGAYAPLDLAYPEDRLRFMVEDSRPKVLLTQDHLRGMFTGVSGDLKIGDLQIVDLGKSETTEAWSRQPDSNPKHDEIGLVPENLVYVIYTSGSTGTPKGVAMPARAAINLLAWQVSESAYAGHQRTLQFAPLGFDVSYQEIFATLCSGGTLVLIDEEKRRNSTHLTRYVLEKRIQRLFLPYVGLQMLAEGVVRMADSLSEGEAFESALQEINVAVEQLRIDDKIRKLFHHLKHCRLNNHYGPTETHAGTAFRLGTQGDQWPALPSIGQPITNARVHILDKYQQFVPVNVVGEIYIGGAGVARGYLNRPDLTEQRFLSDPFIKEAVTQKEAARMYRTGDLGRWRPDGTIEFLGRNDTQVKIRGFRVELGEIEAILQEQSGVRGCAVVAKTSGKTSGANGSKRLVAYVVGDRDHEELRRDLKSKLPAYMVPSVIVGLPELPQSGNGKIDRLALEKLEDSGLSGEHYEAPGTATEEQLADIWADVLEITRVGRHDNFFDLGGHSLLATMLVTRLESAFGFAVPVRAIFESPTIAELAETIEPGLKEGRRLPEKKEKTPKRVAPGPRPSLFPLSYQQEQLWFLDRLNPDNDFYNVPMTWRLKGDLDVASLERSLHELVRRHEVLRTCFVVGEREEPKQKVVGAELNAVIREIDTRLPVVDLRDVAASDREEQARKVLAKEAGKAFDLGRAPLWRAVLVRTGEHEHVLGLTLHHIVCDDWSLGLLMGELGKLYAGFARGEESPLPDLEMQYGDYALEQREELHGGRFERQMAYWKTQLSGMPHVLELPTDFARPPRQSFRGGTEYRILQGDLWDRLIALGREEKASSLMLLLAACQVLLMRYSGQEDFGIGTVVANRKRKETRGLIGFFLNTLVIRANLKGEPSFRAVLRRVREAVLSGYEHQDLSFEKLVEELAPNRDLGRSPLFQVAFILRRAFEGEGEGEFGGLALAPFELDPGTSKFDLIVSVQEGKRSAIISLNYTSDLYEPEMVRRMLEQYECLLEGIVADADQQIWSLPMVRELSPEAHRSPDGLDRSDREDKLPPAQFENNIVEILDARAESAPHEPVVIQDGTQMSCGDLCRRANQLAHYLAHIGVSPESRVGIFMHESQDMMVALVGVLKAGCAYVLLDVLNPKDRLRAIAGHSQIAVLLTQEGLRRRFPQTGVRVVCLDSEWEAIGAYHAAKPNVSLHPQSLACVVYTAASGERVQGWMVEHGGLMRLISARQGDGSSQNEPAIESRWPEIWSRLTSTSFLTGASGLLISEPESGRFRSNDGAEIHLLDRNLQRTAIGVPGELWISGPGAGRGYLGWASLTAEKFVPDPFSVQAGARMRGSGVKARYRQDGTIELMGRLDDRVEIGGYQVELGEIEAALAKHEIVRTAVAVVRPNGELVAYVVLHEGKKLGQSDLGAYLYDRLPSYMIPAAFITLQELPRNSGGEVDRAALAVLGQEQLTKEFALPSTELERTIAAAWQSVLAIEQVGIHDNFFDLGGHSLLMIQLHQKLRGELPVEIELLHLFQFPTIDSLVRFLHAGYNFGEKSRETQDRAGKQKSAFQKFKRNQTS